MDFYNFVVVFSLIMVGLCASYELVSHICKDMKCKKNRRELIARGKDVLTSLKELEQHLNVVQKSVERQECRNGEIRKAVARLECRFGEIAKDQNEMRERFNKNISLINEKLDLRGVTFSEDSLKAIAAMLYKDDPEFLQDEIYDVLTFLKELEQHLNVVQKSVERQECWNGEIRKAVDGYMYMVADKIGNIVDQKIDEKLENKPEE